MRNKRRKKGFTLLEVLLVIAIIAILAGIVIVAINPAKQLAVSRDAQRSSDVNTILNAVYQYAINTGSIPATITDSQTEICASEGVCTGLIDLSVLTEDGTYITTIPIDPTGATTNGAGYEIFKTGDKRVTVIAPDAENTVISITK